MGGRSSALWDRRTGARTRRGASGAARRLARSRQGPRDPVAVNGAAEEGGAGGPSAPGGGRSAALGPGQHRSKHWVSSSDVTFHGHIPRHELAPYYRAADVVAVSSRHEAQLVVALEAALCGTPTVGTAVGLVADFASPSAPAVPVGDDGALAGTIQAALQPDIGPELGRAACRLVRAEYLAAQTADRLMAMYRNHATHGEGRITPCRAPVPRSPS